MKIAPNAQLDDGLLDICLVGAVPKTTLLYQLTQVFAGRHVGHPAVSMLRASRVSLEADPPQPLLIDGEVIGSTPATVTLTRHALPIKVPTERQPSPGAARHPTPASGRRLGTSLSGSPELGRGGLSYSPSPACGRGGWGVRASFPRGAGG